MFKQLRAILYLISKMVQANYQNGSIYHILYNIYIFQSCSILSLWYGNHYNQCCSQISTFCRPPNLIKFLSTLGRLLSSHKCLKCEVPITNQSQTKKQKCKSHQMHPKMVPMPNQNPTKRAKCISVQAISQMKSKHVLEQLTQNPTNSSNSCTF